MLHVISWSGGKDSTATVLLFKEHWDEIVKAGDRVVILYAEVMYDLKRNVSGELPAIVDFVNTTKTTFQEWGFEVETLRSDRDFLYCFNHVIKTYRTHPEHLGATYGFPISQKCSVKRDCKERALKAWHKKHAHDDYIEYVGMAINEPGRLTSLHRNSHKVSLLERYGYTNQMAFELCRQRGFLSPQYSLDEGKQRRGGCWFCPNAKDCEHRQVMECLPDIWDEYVALEDTPGLAFPKWNCYEKETLHERDARLRLPVVRSEERYHQMTFDEWLQNM